ncbi:MAG: DUF2764 family protein [Lewinellaceae bacterium]|nr:DUF2764 family protein [Lewinellaceae bacterium]
MAYSKGSETIAFNPVHRTDTYNFFVAPLKKRHYYYLLSGLPDMALEQSKVPLTLSELMEAFRLSLHPEDLQLARLVLLPADNRNLMALLQKTEAAWKPEGQFSRQTMEEGLEEPGLLPSYMNRFYRAYKEDAPLWPAMSWENQLARLTHEYLMAHTTGFLKQWFTFENYLKNILSAWNIREYKLAADGQFIGENVVTEALRKSHARDFGLALEVPFLDKLMHALEQDKLLEREKALARIKWNYIDELNTFNYFTVEAALGYLLKWIMLDRWTRLDTQRGQEVIGNLMDRLENSIEIPQTFALA